MAYKGGQHISAWSVLQLLRKLLGKSGGICPLCNTIKKDHKDDCDLQRHIQLLEVESGNFKTGVK